MYIYINVYYIIYYIIYIYISLYTYITSFTCFRAEMIMHRRLDQKSNKEYFSEQ